MFKEQRNIVEKELEQIKDTKHGKVGQIWAIRKKVLGGKKTSSLPTAIKHPTTGKLLFDRNNIKETTLNYCVQTLSNNHPEERYREEIQKKKEKVKDILKNTDGIFIVNKDIFDQNIQKFKQSRKKNYNFLTKAGLKFQNVVFLFCLRMLLEEKFPTSFNNTTLHMVYKVKADRKICHVIALYIARNGYPELQKVLWSKEA